MDKNIRIFSSLRNGYLTGPQLTVLLNRTSKTPVSAAAVKRLENVGLLSRVSNHIRDCPMRLPDETAR